MDVSNLLWNTIREKQHTINDLLQGIETGNRTVDLSSSVVRDNDTVAADLNSLLGVSHALDALDSKRLAAAELLPRLDQPRDLAPVVRAAVPDIVDPLRTGLVGHGLWVNAVLREALLEHGVGEA